VLWTFVPIAALMTIAPGPATAMVVRSALRGGWRAGVLTVAGNAVGVVAWALLSVLGVSALVAASQVAFVALKVGGAALLVWFGVRMLLDRGADINAVDVNGETVMHSAAYKNLPGAVKFLAAKGARIDGWNRENKFGWTPLAIATGYRFGNFKPSPDTEAALREVMIAAGVKSKPTSVRPMIVKGAPIDTVGPLDFHPMLKLLASISTQTSQSDP